MNSAKRRTAAVFGALVAMAGFEHGLGETLQGSVRPSPWMFPSWPDVRALDAVAGEPAMTLIPNLLIAGLATMAVSLIFLIVVLTRLGRRRTPVMLAFLSVSLLLVGGGFFPPTVRTGDRRRGDPPPPGRSLGRPCVGRAPRDRRAGGLCVKVRGHPADRRGRRGYPARSRPSGGRAALSAGRRHLRLRRGGPRDRALPRLSDERRRAVPRTESTAPDSSSATRWSGTPG